MSSNTILRLTLTTRILFHRRMFAALRSLPSASQLAHSICMGHEPNQGQLYISLYLLVVVFADGVCPVNDNEFRHNIVQVDPLWQSNYVMTNFMINNRKEA